MFLKFYVAYRALEDVSLLVDGTLAGRACFYAEAQDALDTGLPCDKVIISRDHRGRFDHIGKPFQRAREGDKKALKKA